eukprot:gene23050-29382_t
MKKIEEADLAIVSAQFDQLDTTKSGTSSLSTALVHPREPWPVTAAYFYLQNHNLADDRAGPRPFLIGFGTVFALFITAGALSSEVLSVELLAARDREAKRRREAE